MDPTLEIHGVTNAWWIGAPPPMYCGDKVTGYWDHVTGLEQNSPPFENIAGRSDVRGCCWWGRGGERLLRRAILLSFSALNTITYILYSVSNSDASSRCLPIRQDQLLHGEACCG